VSGQVLVRMFAITKCVHFVVIKSVSPIMEVECALLLVTVRCFSFVFCQVPEKHRASLQS